MVVTHGKLEHGKRKSQLEHVGNCMGVWCDVRGVCLVGLEAWAHATSAKGDGCGLAIGHSGH